MEILVKELFVCLWMSYVPILCALEFLLLLRQRNIFSMSPSVKQTTATGFAANALSHPGVQVVRHKDALGGNNHI